MIHALKISTEHFKYVISGKKTYEVRKNDRPYSVGDFIGLNEYDTEKQKYTGNSCLCYIDHILNDSEYCKAGYIVMSIKPCVINKITSPVNPLSMVCDYSVPYASRGESK